MKLYLKQEVADNLVNLVDTGNFNVEEYVLEILDDYDVVVDVMTQTIEHNILTIRMLVVALDKQTAQLEIANSRIEKLNRYVRDLQSSPMMGG